VVGADRDGRGFGARAHIPAVLAAPGFDLTAICTTREETARLAAERYGAERYYAGIDALLADDDIDLITIAVTVRSHLPLVWAALKADKPVYCEWPLGLNVEEAATMARLARERGVLTAVGTQGRHAPGLVHLRELIAEGYVGRPLFFRMHHLLPRFPVRSNHWWSSLEAEHSGALGVACSHATDALEGVLGPIVSVSGYADTLHPHDSYADSGEPFDWSARDTVSYQAVLASGVTGSAHISNVTTEQIGFRLEVYGEEGQLTVTAPYYVSYSPMTLHGMRAGDDAPQEIEVPARLLRAGGLEPGSPGHTLAHALGALRDAHFGGPPFAPDMTDAHRLHLLIATVKRSWHERRWLDVPGRDALLG
jgi:predicted dehydrogenase